MLIKIPNYKRLNRSTNTKHLAYRTYLNLIKTGKLILKNLIRKIEKYKQSKLFGSFIITTLGSGFSKALLIIATFFCTNALTQAEFGEFSFVRNTLTMILTICALNFSSLCTKFTTEAKVSKDSLHKLFLLFLFSFIVSTISGGSLVILPDYVLSSLLGSYDIVFYFRIAGLFIPFFMLQPLLEGVMRGLMKFKLIGIMQIGSSLLYMLTVIVGILLNGVDGAVYGLYIYYFVYSTASFIVIIKMKKTGNYIHLLHGFINQMPSVYRIILPVFILSFVEAPIFWYLQVLLTKYDSVAAVGSMTVMKQVRNFAVLIPNYFFNTYLAFAGTLNAEHKHKEYFNQFDRLFKLFIYIGIILFLIFSISSKIILGLYGQEYSADYLCLIISNGCIPFVMLISLMRTELLLQEHQRYLMIVSIAWNILWVVLFFLLVQINVAPLMSFFLAELIGVIINYILILIVYKSDKIKLLKK